MGKESNPARFTGTRDSIVMLGKIKGERSNLTPEELAANEEHARQMAALYPSKDEKEA